MKTVNVEFLKSYMVVNNITESKFAEIIGVSHSTLNRVLNGKRGLGSKCISGIMEHCTDISFSQLFISVDKLPKGNRKNSKTA